MILTRYVNLYAIPSCTVYKQFLKKETVFLGGKGK